MINQPDTSFHSLYNIKTGILSGRQVFFCLLFQQCDVLKAFVHTSKVLPSPELETFADSLVDNTLPSLTLSPQDYSHKAVVIEMVIHTAAVLLSGNNRVLEPLRNLAFMPNTMQVK